MTYRNMQRTVNGFGRLGSLLPSGTPLAPRCTVMLSEAIPPSTALVIATDESTIEPLRRVMDDVGLSIVPASSAAAALEQVPDVRPLAIVIDDRVNDLPLPALVRQFHAAYDRVPIIVIGDVPLEPEAIRVGGCELVDRAILGESVQSPLATLVQQIRSPAAPAKRVLSSERLKFLHTYGSLFRRGPRMRELERTVFAI